MNNPVSLGVTQFNGMQLKQHLRVAGQDWKLRRDATDATSSFPHSRVSWTNAGCDPIANTNGQVYHCWIAGVIAPTPGTLERPVQVMYIGFHTQMIQVLPNTLTQADLDRMHVYISDGVMFAQDFVNSFLGLEEPVATAREAVSPFPPKIDMSVIGKQPQVEGQVDTEVPEQEVELGS